MVFEYFGCGHGAVGEFRTNDVITSDNSRKGFDTLQLKSWLSQNLKRSNYVFQSKIQEKSLPAVLTGNDVIVESKSGTGKTLVFTLAILERIREDIPKIQALVLAPTREIAIQAHTTIENLGKEHVTAALIIGGTSLVQNKRDLRRKKPQVLIGTPGRILDLYSRGDISGSTIEILVLDEADELLQNETFRIQVKNIREGLSFSRLQSLCLSATYPASLRSYIMKFLRPDPMIVRSSNGSYSNQLEGIGVSCFSFNSTNVKEQKGDLLKRREIKLNYTLKILEAVDFNQCFIFAHNHTMAHRASVYLNSKGWPNTLMSGKLEQDSRTQAWEQLVSKQTAVVVCTDLAARGIDSAHADLVINIEMSNSSEVMTHRIGRAGRFGGRGESIFLLAVDDLPKFDKMKKEMNFTVNEFVDFESLLSHSKSKLQFSNLVKQKERLLGEDTVEIEADDVNVNNNIDYTQPEIPPLWEVLNVPGPPEAVKKLSEARQKRTQTAIIEAEVQKIEERELDLRKENLDIFTDNEFQQWRLQNPRSTESVMSQRSAILNYVEENNLKSDGLVSSILENTRTSMNKICDDSSEELATFSDEESSPTETTISSSSERSSDEDTDGDFYSLYTQLFTDWMALHQ